MANGPINLAYMYPDILSLHGDRGNIWAFERVAANIGLELNVSRTDNPEEGFDISSQDILFFSPGELTSAGFLAGALKGRKAVYEDYLAAGKAMLVIGTSLAAFGGHTKRVQAESFDGLGIIDADFEEKKTCYSNDAIMRCEVYGEEIEAVGGQIQVVRILLGETEKPLGRNEYGYGNKKGEDEGVLHGSFLHTNLLGPVFAKNPWFAEAILRHAAKQKGIETSQRIAPYELEEKSNSEIKRFIQMKIEKYDKTRLDVNDN